MRASWLRKQSGQAVVVVAVAILVLAAIMMLALDGGGIYLDRRQLQNAADAAALAGAGQLMTLPRSYTTIHHQAITTLIKNLPGTTISGTVCNLGCPNQPTIGQQGANGVGTLDLGAGYYAKLSVTNAYNYQVTAWHLHANVIAPVHGFQSTTILWARATAQNASLPYAIVLLQSSNPAYANLKMSQSNTALNLVGPGGLNPSERGGIYSNASLDPGSGNIYFAPCTAGPPVSITGPGTSGDLWAVSEQAGDASRVANQAFCQQTAGVRSAPTILPDPLYPEPAAPGVSYNGASIPTGATQILCPGHYTSRIDVSGTAILYPGVYHVDNGGIRVSGTLRTFQQPPADSYPVSDPCGPATTLQAWGGFDPGVIIEITPTSGTDDDDVENCSRNSFSTTGSSSTLSLAASPRYFNISLYVELMSGWQSACSSGPGGTWVVRITGGGSYDVQGVIYGANDNMRISSGSVGSGVGELVGRTLLLNGGSAVNVRYSPSRCPYLKGLVQ